MRRLLHQWPFVLVIGGNFACGGEEARPTGEELTASPDSVEPGTPNPAPQPASTTNVTPADSTFEEVVLPPPGPFGSGDAGPGTACASASSRGELQELALAFAFDVSGSMGKGDEPYHNRELKWEPVVAATKAFFESDSVSRVRASLVFFPAEDDRCDSETYADPDVALEEVPSSAFAEAIDGVTPETEDDWRGGTPTLAVMEATLQHVQELQAAGSSAKHAVVLITDGTPQGCSDEEDSVEAVSEAIIAARGDVPVYVIGVANPATPDEPEPPDNVTGLHQLAEAGGTTSAFIIDTGDPTKTITDFGAVIESIRTAGLSCELSIPAPPAGQSFDKDKINVSLAIGEQMGASLVYSADCADETAWRYDVPEAPTRIVLCADACETATTASDAALQVEFGCERRTSTVK